MQDPVDTQAPAGIQSGADETLVAPGVDAPVMDIQSLRQRYLADETTPEAELAAIHVLAEQYRTHHIWLHLLTAEELAPYFARLKEVSPEDLPLWGIPFAIKDNIDLAGIPTTAACPAWQQRPEQSAFVVERLIAAGAIPVGKTNMDQFATGLVGTRSPHGPVPNALLPEYISGGSSSGSAVAVKLGLASFALGTDTAGSGRVPAAFNELYGVKPSVGWWSTRGVVPACRTLDCVSVFAATLEDAATVADVLDEFDTADSFSRPTPQLSFEPRTATIGVLDLAGCGIAVAPDFLAAYNDWVASLAHPTVTIDATPFLAAAKLLYEGPWVSERYLAIRELIEGQPEVLHPVTRTVIATGRDPSALDAFAAQYRLADLARQTAQVWTQIDALAVPTAPTIYRHTEVAADPIDTNSHLGSFTNFVNLLDLSALAIPGPRTDEQRPFGVTLLAPNGFDLALLRLANELEHGGDKTQASTQPALPLPPAAGLGALSKPRADAMAIAVCGAHLDGQPLNTDLRARGAYLVQATTTSAAYRLYALPDGKRPALVRAADGVGSAIQVEVWSLPLTAVGGFLATIAPPLGLGSVELADGSWVYGFIGEGRATDGAQDVTTFGGWRSYRASLAAG